MRAELTMRVYSIYGFVRTADEAKDKVERFATYGDDMFKLGEIKLSLDGGLYLKQVCSMNPTSMTPKILVELDGRKLI
jgi:hypothetical protein